MVIMFTAKCLPKKCNTAINVVNHYVKQIRDKPCDMTFPSEVMSVQLPKKTTTTITL